MKNSFLLPLSIVLTLSACTPQYTVRPSSQTANIYLQDGQFYQSQAYVSRDAKKCTYLEKFNHHYKIRSPNSIRGPYKIEANMPLAVSLQGFYFASGTSLVYQCDLIFSHEFLNDKNYLIRLIDQDNKCGVLVYQSDNAGFPTASDNQPINIEYRKFTLPMFSSGPACAD